MLGEAGRNEPGAGGDPARRHVAVPDERDDGPLGAELAGQLERGVGGGRARAAQKDLYGVGRVTSFLDNVLRKHWRTSAIRLVEVNGATPVLVAETDGAPQALITLDASNRGVERVLLVVNPDKLRQFAGDRWGTPPQALRWARIR